MITTDVDFQNYTASKYFGQIYVEVSLSEPLKLKLKNGNKLQDIPWEWSYLELRRTVEHIFNISAFELTYTGMLAQLFIYFTAFICDKLYEFSEEFRVKCGVLFPDTQIIDDKPISFELVISNDDNLRVFNESECSTLLVLEKIPMPHVNRRNVRNICRIIKFCN